MNASEPMFLNEIQVKQKCISCEGSGKTGVRNENKCWRCEGKGFFIRDLERAILDLVKENFHDMLKSSIGN